MTEFGKRNRHPVVASRRGFPYEVEFNSAVSAAKALGVSNMTIYRRCIDGNVIKTDNNLSIHVRYKNMKRILL